MRQLNGRVEVLKESDTDLSLSVKSDLITVRVHSDSTASVWVNGGLVSKLATPSQEGKQARYLVQYEPSLGFVLDFHESDPDDEEVARAFLEAVGQWAAETTPEEVAANLTRMSVT